MKTVLLVPGFTEDYHTRDYAALQRAIEARGYAVVFVPIQWKCTTIDDWVRELEQVYQGYEPTETVLAGFSYGAMTAFMAATKRTPAAVWLFSFSPYFAEDIQSRHMKDAWLRHIGKRRVWAFSALNFSQLSHKLTCQTLLFIGEKEMKQWPIMQERFKAASRLLMDCKSIVVPHAGHDCTHKDYIEAVATAIKKQ